LARRLELADGTQLMAELEHIKQANDKQPIRLKATQLYAIEQANDKQPIRLKATQLNAIEQPDDKQPIRLKATKPNALVVQITDVPDKVHDV